MKRILGLMLGTALSLGAQASARRVWFTTIGDVRATPDGWVQWQIGPPSPLPPHHDAMYGLSARFAPDAVRAWVAAARRAMDETSRSPGITPVPTLTNGSASISLKVHRDAQHTGYEMFATSCRGNANVDPSRGELLLLIDAAADAANAASSLRATPREPTATVFSAAEVTCMASPVRAYMPAWSGSFGRRPADRAESLARFVIAADGRVDLSTLAWERTPAAAPLAAATAALADWQFQPALMGDQAVRQWSHARIWFADSTDAAEWQLAGRSRTRSFVARGDGRIEHAYLDRTFESVYPQNEVPHIREAYTPSAVRAWLEGNALAGRPSTPDERGTDLVAPGGIIRHAGGWYDGCASIRRTGAGRLSRAAWPVLADSVRLALAEATQRPLSAIDSMRVYGETEVTCAATAHGRLAPTLTRSPNGDELVLSFVVERNGTVRPASLTVLGPADGQNVSRIRAALAGQRWQPGRLAGVRVAQRAHLVLYPGNESDATLATTACAQASDVAVRLRVHEPVRGIAPTNLMRIAHALSRRVAHQARPSATEGTFALVLDDAGRAHFFSWMRAPRDTIGALAAQTAFGTQWFPGGSEPVVSSVPTAALALEADLLPDCP
jgi:hypothetical protein